MEIDVSADIGLEPLTLKFGPNDSQTKEVDVYALSDELATAYDQLVTEKAELGQIDAKVRPIFEKYGFQVPKSFAGCDITSQRIRAAVIERKKKFASDLWGTGADLPAWPAITPDSPLIPNDPSVTECLQSSTT